MASQAYVQKCLKEGRCVSCGKPNPKKTRRCFVCAKKNQKYASQYKYPLPTKFCSRCKAQKLGRSGKKRGLCKSCFASIRGQAKKPIGSYGTELDDVLW